MRKTLFLATVGLAAFQMGAGLYCPAVSGEELTLKTAAASSLEGTTWSVKVTPDDAAQQKGEKPFDDSLIFKDGKVTMSAGVKAGFSPSAYTATTVGGAVYFKADQVSENQGKTAWTAKLSGDSIKGTMTWTKTDGTVLHYTVEGQKAAKSGTS